MPIDKRELTDEGRRMFENLEAYDDELFEKRPTRRRKAGTKTQAPEEMIPIVLSEEMKQLMTIKANLVKLMDNSRRVIQDCDKIMSSYKTKEEYLASEAKIAKYCHQNFLERMERVLNGQDPLNKV